LALPPSDLSVDLYENPTFAASATSDGSGDLELSPAEMEVTVRLIADGLSPSFLAERATRC
jgi:hypothetical protein